MNYYNLMYRIYVFVESVSIEAVALATYASFYI